MTPAESLFRQDYIVALELLKAKVDREIEIAREGGKPTLTLSLSTDLVVRIGEILWNKVLKEELERDTSANSH